MEGVRQARKTIHKQQQEINKLRKEQEELQRNLKCMSRQKQDREDARILHALLEHKDILEEELEKEKQQQKQLEKEISNMHLKLAEAKRVRMKPCKTQMPEAQRKQNTIYTLENKLDIASTRFNIQMAKNRQLREELQSFHKELDRLQQLHSKLVKEHQEIRKNIGEITNLSNAAHDAKVEAEFKLSMMKEKAAEDLAKFKEEMIELDRVLGPCNTYKKLAKT